MKSFIAEKKKEIILLALFGVSIFLIVFQFTDTPRVWIDEGVFTEVARNLAVNGSPGLQVSPGNILNTPAAITAGYPVIFPVALSFLFFDIGLWQARLPMVIYMFMLVGLFYLFTRKRYGYNTALLSVLMLISFSPFYGNGRPVQGEVPGLVFLVLGLLLMLYWEETSFESRKWALFSGLALGVAAVAKPTFLIVLSMALVLTSFFWIRKIKNNNGLLLIGLGYILPIILWLFIQFPTMDILLESIPKYFFLASNHGSDISTLQTILQNFSKFFKESTPILFALLLVTSCVYFLTRFFKKENNNLSITEYLILSFVIINWLSYLPGTGWYRYFFPAHTLLYLVFPASILGLAYLTKKTIIRRVIIAVPIVLIALQFTHLVFLSQTSYTGSRTRNVELERALSSIEPSKKVLFYGSPEPIIFLKGQNYWLYLSVADTLNTGNRDTVVDNSFDYIFSKFALAKETSMPCFEKKPVDRYFLYTKTKTC